MTLRLQQALQNLIRPQPLIGKLGYTDRGIYAVETSENAAQYNVRLNDGRFVTAYHQNLVSPDPDKEVELKSVLQEGKVVFVITGATGNSSRPPGVSPHSHSRESGMYFEVDTWLLSGFRVTVLSGLQLKVSPGWYWYQNERRWFTGAVVDVTSELPATADQHAWTTLSFALATETFTLTTGTDQSVVLPLLEVDIPASSDEDVAAIRLINGMTTVLDSYIVDLRFTLWRKEHLLAGAATLLTLASGAADAAQSSSIVLAAQSGTSDDLDTLTVTGPSRFIVLQADAGDTITVKHSTGNIELNGAADFALSGDKTLALFWDGVNLADIGIGGGGGGAFSDLTDVDPALSPTDGQVPVWDNAAGYWGAGGGALALIILQDQKAQNTVGGTFTSGAWRTRDLNTEVVDTGSNCTLSSNQFTLLAGTYRIQAYVPAAYVRQHQARLRNITDSTTTVEGTSEYTTSSDADATTTKSIIEGRFTIASSKAFEIQHQCGVTLATNGFGAPANFGTEIYTTVRLEKES